MTAEQSQQLKPPMRQDKGIRSLLPGSLVSVSVHAALLVVASMSLRGCEHSAPASAGGRDFRTVGLAVVPNDSVEAADQPKETPQDMEADQPAEEAVEETATAIPTEAPSVDELLNPSNTTRHSDSADESKETENVIGSGIPTDALPAAGTGIPDLIRPRAAPGTTAAGSLTPGPNATSFMNIVGDGQSFVYVIDISSSMQSGERLNLARSQLKSSLRLLKPNQSFQVLFYNEVTTQMKLRGRIAEDLYLADPVKVLLAEQQIDRVRAEGGTEHLQPILHALRLEPDVVYFLTDGDQPKLSRNDLARVRDQNRSGANIHVIEFASGVKESRELSWLQLLASQSGGKYSYIPLQGLRP